MADLNFEHVKFATSTSNPILIVDDNMFNICAVESLFAQFNFECDSCVNGEEAVKLIKGRCLSKEPMYKLILMDYSMPDCDGPTATKLIRKLVIERQNMAGVQPIICCLTAYSEQQYKDSAIRSGMDCILVKPIFKASAHKILLKAGLI